MSERIYAVEGFWNRVEKIRLYEKLSAHRLMGKIVNREVLSYLFFGGLTTLVAIVSFALFEWLFESVGWPGLLQFVRRDGESYAYIDANVISWVFAVAFAFVTNKLFVFEARSARGGALLREIGSFVGSRLTTLLIETALLYLFVEILGMKSVLAKMILMVVVVILNYVLSKIFVFKKAKDGIES